MTKSANHKQGMVHVPFIGMTTIGEKKHEAHHEGHHEGASHSSESDDVGEDGKLGELPCLTDSGDETDDNKDHEVPDADAAPLLGPVEAPPPLPGPVEAPPVAADGLCAGIQRLSLHAAPGSRAKCPFCDLKVQRGEHRLSYKFRVSTCLRDTRHIHLACAGEASKSQAGVDALVEMRDAFDFEADADGGAAMRALFELQVEVAKSKLPHPAAAAGSGAASGVGP